MASALEQKACRDGYSPYTFGHCVVAGTGVARADGSSRHLLAHLARINVLVIDDWAIATTRRSERREAWETCEDRYQTRFTALTSQLPVSQ